jgi:MFS family permease
VTAIATTSPTGTNAALRNAAPLLIGVALLMVGNGLSSTLLGTRAGLIGFSPTVIGIVLSGYYVGFVVGSMTTPGAIERVGHVRVFAGLASLGSGALLIHLVTPDAVTWFALRAVSGLCIAGLYVVSETWLNGAATNESRGTLLATYMAVVGAGVFSGQMLYAASDPAGVGAFVMASVLVSLAVVRVVGQLRAPEAPEPSRMPWGHLIEVAPLAPVGAIASGFVVAAMLSGGVVYAAEAGLDRQATGAFIGAALLGGVALPVPLGRWSDRVDRRLVIAVATAGGAAASLAVAVVGPTHRLIIIALTTVAGGATFSLYSLTLAHANDYLDDHLTVAAGARMVLLQGVGAIAGPVVGAALVGRVGPGALFVSMAVAYSTAGLFAVARMFIRAAAPEEDRADFSPVAVGGATVTGFEANLDDLYPATGGTIEHNDGAVGYQERGPFDRDAVVLLGTPPGRDVEWRNVLAALAFDGFRAITAWTADDFTRALTTENVFALLRHLELPWASPACRTSAAGSQADRPTPGPHERRLTIVESGRPRRSDRRPRSTITSPYWGSTFAGDNPGTGRPDRRVVPPVGTAESDRASAAAGQIHSPDPRGGVDSLK